MSAAVTMAADDAAATASAAGVDEIEITEIDMGKLVGGGSFGQVYAGTWRGTAVAVKLLRGASELDHDPRTLRDFRAEVRMLSRLR